jgi:hypothetical protein
MATSNPILYNGVSSTQSVFETSTTREHCIGTMGSLPGGKRFHYASLVSGTAIGPNKVAAACPPVAAHVSETGTLTGTSVAGSINLSATLGATAAYLNEYEEGHLKIQSATTGAGQAFRIPEHAAVLASGVLSFQSPDPVVTATSGTTTWSLVHNPYGSVVICPTTLVAPAVGVTLVNWPAAASSAAPVYGWLQTWGLCSVLLDTSALVAGHGVGLSAITAGACAVAVETDIEQRIGVSFEAIGTDDIYADVFLQIA